MADPIGLISFPGIQSIKEASFTFQQGISPSYCSITITPQQQAPPINGTLSFTYGNVSFQLLNCRIDEGSFTFDENGFLISLSILDRRWKWQFGEIYGEHNIPKADGNGVLADTEKTPAQLAKLLLEAMGEGGFDIAAIPNIDRPHVIWTGANPAAELANLCDQLGCRIVLQLNNKVKIVKIGQGQTLPNGPIISDQIVYNPPEAPDKIKILAAPTIYETAFILEAVGLDVDGSIKPIDDLNYKPDGGWEQAPADDFENVTDAEHRKFALKSVYKWYRVSKYLDGTLSFPAPIGQVKNIKQIQVRDKRTKTRIDPAGERVEQDAVIWGSFVDGGWSVENVPAGSIYSGDFDVGEDGIVRFRNYVYRNAGPDNYLIPAEAKLYLLTSFTLRDQDTHAVRRFSREKPTGEQNGTGPMVLLREDLQLKVVQDFDYESNHRGDPSDNLAQLNFQADGILDDALGSFLTETPQQRQYAGFIKQDLDGAIVEVSYSCGDRGAATTISRHQESNILQQNHRARRLKENLKNLRIIPQL